MDLSAYRIVQEALTNALKHGGDGVHARVLLRYDDAGLEIEVTDDGRGPVADERTAGRGLIGMRERVALFGGDARDRELARAAGSSSRRGSRSTARAARRDDPRPRSPTTRR